MAENLRRNGGKSPCRWQTRADLCKRDELRKIITANGKSWSDPVYSSDGRDIDKNASRRVEIKFRLKDDEMVKEMAEILGE